MGSTRPASTYVIYNGVASAAEFDHLYSMTSSRLTVQSDRPFTFSMLGVLHPSKGQDEAIRALGLLAGKAGNVRLLLVGDGDSHQLRVLTDRLGLADKVEFWGYIDDPYEAYLVSDAVLVCSRFEAMGRVTVEAMSACLPVIGYDHAGTSEIVEHRETGLLYRDGPEALAGCMRQFIENPTWARQLGQNGWQVAREKYTTEIFAESVHKVMVGVVE
jgi:glycosyltransferase involved in cell wall biosynthesis